MTHNPSPTMTYKPLTLIVATTKQLGIGKNGTLPWPTIKGEMAFFARVTKRVNPTSSSIDSSVQNAVIMGSKTYNSIPPKFRPLKDRVNIIISRQMSTSLPESETKGRPVHVVRGIDEAVELVSMSKDMGKAFVIGGGSIYEAAFKHPTTEQVLLTKILKPHYECDTFFPVDLDACADWREGSQQEWEQATGEELGEEELKRSEGDVEYQFCLYSKTNSNGIS